tara:strand:+ start:257 stop:1198 length:942 start_codon:yes stop_codon:yes gene_type:complete
MTPSKTPTTKSVSEFLEELVKGTHQGSVDDILHITKVIRTAKETLSEEDFRDLRDRWVKSQGMDKGGQKVWSKLLQIGLDDRLEELKDHLPCTYTTLHLVHCLSDEELKVGVAEGHIHPKVSQGSLNRWVKYFRFEGQTEEVPEDFSSLVKVLGPASVSEEVLNRFKGDLDKLVSVYGFKTQYEEDQTMVTLRQQRSVDRSQEMESRLTKDLRSTWDRAEDSLKTLFSLGSLEDLVLAPMQTFTGFLNKVSKGRDQFWSLHGTDYIHKVALEYLRTTARAQRFNYRRRLKEVATSHPQYAEMVRNTLEEWMKY